MKFTELPAACPSCAKPFSAYLKPVRKMQSKALMLAGVGVAITLVLIPAGILGVLYFADNVPLDAVRNKRGVGIAYLLLGALILSPSVLFGAWAMKLPKVVRLSCTKCKWSENFIVDNRG